LRDPGKANISNVFILIKKANAHYIETLLFIFVQSLKHTTTPLAGYGAIPFLHNTVRFLYGTVPAWYWTLSVLYGTVLARNGMLLARYSLFLARYALLKLDAHYANDVDMTCKF
jgi:hypothetical protein